MGLSATELRIGNFVNTSERSGASYQMCRQGGIKTINNGSCNIAPLNCISPIVTVNLKNIDPIPLTEEWLLKVKWKYQDRDVNRRDKKKERFYISPFFGEHREYWIELLLSNNSFGRSFMWLCWDIGGGKDHIHLPMGHKMDYVHQLQNLYFALIGEELTINNEL